MTSYTVLNIPDPGLKLKAQPVETINQEILDILSGMMETMYQENGCGLAAPQIGINKKLVVFDISSVENNIPPTKMINPEIYWFSEETEPFEEGCLSVPGVSATVVRPKTIKIRYTDEKSVKHDIEAEGFLARCLQHEIDHLNGKLYIDYLSPLERNSLIKKMEELKKENLLKG